MGNLSKILIVTLLAGMLVSFPSCTGCSSSGRKKLRMEADRATSKSISKNKLVSNSSSSLRSPKKTTCGLVEGVYYPIKNEVDGDTFWLDDGCDGVKIRLIGINAPENKNAFNHIRKEPFGDEAKQFLSQLIKNTEVRVELDVDSLDQYGRTLAYCYTKSGIFINRKMLEVGLAMIETVQPNVKYQKEFYKAQIVARERKLNLWGE